ncbi:hypothetical protein M0R88_03250 [Halorussus gelatinilyticus]|uniref:Uncharacterized protein n=1 Tax=Halorussus gelatinilyticus TaxID=2937524 RepID=A0A8U0IKC4_9EURY|nr:hypothetical protein [Halorussus gelatinilyticus]UPW01126.1 hypothetical protein M0R88_03250 [Halorussus gelatinilyticus]
MNRERRAVLRWMAAAVGAVGSGAVVGSGAAERGESDAPGANDAARSRRNADRIEREALQQVNTELPPGVTLFDLNGDGSYTATVESGTDVQDGSHPNPIHVTSSGNSTVDYAASIVAPSGEPTLGSLGELRYDYYEGPNNVNSDDPSGGLAPDETFLVVENDDGRHGMYLTSDDGSDPPSESWRTFDVAARLAGGNWFEYTDLESGYDGRNFSDAVARFGAEARLVRVGVGHGDAVNPATLDVYYDNLVVDGETLRLPTSVAKRVS